MHIDFPAKPIFTSTDVASTRNDVILARLIAGTGSSSGADDFSLGRGVKSSPAEKLLALFTSKIADKVFFLRGGIWIDREYVEQSMAKRKETVEAYSDEYFALVREVKGLAKYLALSDRIVVVIRDRVIEVTPPKE